MTPGEAADGELATSPTAKSIGVVKRMRRPTCVPTS